MTEQQAAVSADMERPGTTPAPDSEAPIVVEDVTMAFGDFVVQRGLNFTVKRSDVFIIMGGSGCGKSTVMRALIGMQRPAEGRVWFDGQNLWEIDEDARQSLLQQISVPIVRDVAIDKVRKLVAVGHIVDDENVAFAARVELTDEITADKPGATCNDNHGLSGLLRKAR